MRRTGKPSEKQDHSCLLALQRGMKSECETVLRGLCNTDEEFEATLQDMKDSLIQGENDRGWEGVGAFPSHPHSDMTC